MLKRIHEAATDACMEANFVYYAIEFWLNIFAHLSKWTTMVLGFWIGFIIHWQPLCGLSLPLILIGAPAIAVIIVCRNCDWSNQ